MTETTQPNPPATPAAEPVSHAPTFEVLPLSKELRETLAEIGYVNPTPVQLAVWEPATRGKDAVVQARTGTGKTAAFGLPIVDHLVRRSVSAVQVLALCPTRELALQVAREVDRLGAKKGIKVVAIYGGASMPRQVEELAGGAQVVVGTPGRVLDHLRRGTLDPRRVRMLVLDEADEMLSMGFERELTAILEMLPAERQTLLFSATLPPDIERLARGKLKSPEYVTLSGDHVGALEIEHFVYLVTSDKLGALVRVIEVEDPESAVVFCNTKDETERVAQALKRQGYDADWLNGDLPQSEREQVMTATREGRLRFLVATDVAARGIDISHLTHVINHDFPQDAEAYVHRTGRTGRAGRTGTAISLITPQDVGGLYYLRLTYKIRPIERQIPTEGELKTRAEADLVNMLVEAFTKAPQHADDLALARRLLTHDRCVDVIAGLMRDHLGARPAAREEASSARRAPKPIPKRVEPPRAPAPKPVAPAPEPQAKEPVAPAAEPQAKEPAAPAPQPQAKEPAPQAPQPQAKEPAPQAPQPQAKEPAPQAPIKGPSPAVAAAPAPSEPRARDHEPRARREDRAVRRSRSTHDAGKDQPARAPEERSANGGHGPAQTNNGAPQERPRHQRHADFATWQPPEEEGDDEPILGPPRSISRAPAVAQEPSPQAPPPTTTTPHTAPAPAPAPALQSDDEMAEIFVNVGRREGARASDFVRVLSDRDGIEKSQIGRIRVRERNTFVSVHKSVGAKAVALLTGAMIAGKSASAEPARERSDDAPAADKRPAEGPAGGPPIDAVAAPSLDGEALAAPPPSGPRGEAGA